MNHTDYFCFCGCGEIVAVEFVGGFAGTGIRVAACSTTKARSPFVTGAEFPRSFALTMTPAESASVAHRDGLVSFGGAR